MSNKGLKKASGIFLSVFASINEAAFSFVGMLTLLQGRSMPLHTRYALGAGSAFAALSIESEVFYHNICTGLDYAFTPEGLKLKIIRDLILNTYNSNPTTQNIFLIQYLELYIKLTQHTHSHHASKEIIYIQNQLYEMDKGLLTYFEEDDSQSTNETNQKFNALFPTEVKEAYFKTYQRKNTLMRAATLFTLLSIPGGFFASCYMTQSLLAVTGLTGTVLTGGVLAIAIIGAIAFYYLMYNTFAEMIYNNHFQKYIKQITNLWKDLTDTGLSKNTPRYKLYLTRLSMLLTAALFTGLIALLTLATLGTWIKTGVTGQVFLFNCAKNLVTILIEASAVLYTAITVIFNAKNIMQTISALFSTNYCDFFQRCYKTIRDEINTPYTEFFASPLTRCLFPLAIIGFALRLMTSCASAAWFSLTLAIHCLSEGVTTDKGFYISAEVAAGANGVAEFFTDIPYLVEGEHEPDFALGKKIDLSLEPPHQHTGVLNKLFFVCFSPLLLTNYLLCRLFSTKGHEEAWKQNVSSFWQSEHTHEHTHADHHKLDHAPKTSVLCASS